MATGASVRSDELGDPGGIADTRRRSDDAIANTIDVALDASLVYHLFTHNIYIGR